MGANRKEVGILAAGCSGRGLEERLAFLGRPRAYPDEPAEVTSVETHMSWVFLAGRFAYKLKKPVRYDSLDFRSLESRRRSCEDEVRLNRRLASDIYLGVVPLTDEKTGGLAIDGAGRPVDWLVRMRCLPHDRMLDQAILSGTVKTGELKAVARLLAKFFAAALPVAVPPAEYRRRLASEVTENRRALAAPIHGLHGRTVETVTTILRKTLMGSAPLFDGRVRRGRIREGHGDLRADHVFLGPKVAVIDCIEFDRDFRIQDSADELAYLALECEMLGSPGVGKVILETCCDLLGDEPSPELIAFYKALRAMMRARLAVMHLEGQAPRDAEFWRTRAQAYLDVAGRYAGQLA